MVVLIADILKRPRKGPHTYAKVEEEEEEEQEEEKKEEEEKEEDKEEEEEAYLQCKLQKPRRRG